jgi:hypothetical protein
MATPAPDPIAQKNAPTSPRTNGTLKPRALTAKRLVPARPDEHHVDRVARGPRGRFHNAQNTEFSEKPAQSDAEAIAHAADLHRVPSLAVRGLDAATVQLGGGARGRQVDRLGDRRPHGLGARPPLISLPEVFERRRAQLRVARRVLDRLVAEPVLDASRIVAGVSEGIAAGMALTTSISATQFQPSVRWASVPFGAAN